MRISHKTPLLLVSPLLLAVAAAYVQWGAFGLPPIATSPAPTAAPTVEPHGFPAWLRITHYVNLLFLVLLVRSGLPLVGLIKLVRPMPAAKVVVFHSFGEGVAIHEGVEGVPYYDSLPIKNAVASQTMLAYEINY